MQIIEAALAFAITMLVLSLICSAFVELIHRFFKLRETGLKYLLEETFDQVLKKYIEPAAKKVETSDTAAAALMAKVRHSFVERMRANRSPGGVQRETQLDGKPQANESPKTWPVSILGGRELTTLSPAEFMERLGTIDLVTVDIGGLLQDANKLANDAAKKAGEVAAGTVDAVLKDVAQKFDVFGKEASAYFEGRARLMSVLVAIALAFAINVDAIDLFTTFLRDPVVRTKMIEQVQAVTAQHKAAQDALANAQKAQPAAPAPPKQDSSTNAQKSSPPPTQAELDKAKQEVEKLKKDLQDEIDKTRKTVAQLSDLGVPIGWDKAKVTLYPPPTKTVCVDKDGNRAGDLKLGETCSAEEKPTQKVDKTSWLRLFFSLLLGGILVGLGGPFWYDAITSLTNIRNIAGSVFGKTQQQAPADSTVRGGDGAPKETHQPKTPVDIFEAAKAARDALKASTTSATPATQPGQ